MHRKTFVNRTQEGANPRKSSPVPPLTGNPFPADMRESFCRFVRHTLQGTSSRLGVSTLFTDSSRKKFIALLKQLNWTGSPEEAREAIDEILTFLRKIKASHEKAKKNPFMDDEDRELFFRNIHLARLYLEKVMNILVGGPHLMVREDISLFRILGDTAPLVGSNGATTADRLFEQFSDLTVEEMIAFVKANPGHPVSEIIQKTPMAVKEIAAAQEKASSRRKLFETFHEYEPSDADMLNVDRIEAFLLFENLLSNALRARATKVTITAKKSKSHPGMAEISVKNDGKGFTPRQLKMARAGKSFSTKKKRPGQVNGIGLPHCRFIVEQHGGTFNIESKGGKGAEITFTLPLSRQ